MTARPIEVAITCPKCRRTSGDAWGQCKGACPMEGSPHYQPGWLAKRREPGTAKPGNRENAKSGIRGSTTPSDPGSTKSGDLGFTKQLEQESAIARDRGNSVPRICEIQETNP